MSRQSWQSGVQQRSKCIDLASVLARAKAAMVILQRPDPGRRSSPGHLPFTPHKSAPETMAVGLHATDEAERLQTAFPETPKLVRSKASGKHPTTRVPAGVATGSVHSNCTDRPGMTHYQYNPAFGKELTQTAAVLTATVDPACVMLLCMCT